VKYVKKDEEQESCIMNSDQGTVLFRDFYDHPKLTIDDFHWLFLELLVQSIDVALIHPCVK